MLMIFLFYGLGLFQERKENSLFYILVLVHRVKITLHDFDDHSEMFSKCFYGNTSTIKIFSW